MFVFLRHCNEAATQPTAARIDLEIEDTVVLRVEKEVMSGVL